MVSSAIFTISQYYQIHILIMIADILKVITRNSSKEDRLIIQLQEENQQLTAQILQIDNKIASIQVEQIINALSHNKTKEHTYKNIGNSSSSKLQAIQQFYALCQVQQQQNKKLQLLNEQLTHITELSQKYDLLGTIALLDFEPEQSNLTFIKQQIQDLTDQLIHWQNQQNANQFHAEDGEIIQEYRNVVIFLDQFKKTAIQIYAHLISSTYQINKSDLVIYKQYFDIIWNQQTCFTQSFIEGLSHFLDRFISYDINDRQYTAIVYELQQNEKMLVIIQKSKIIFDSSEILLHYQHMITSLSNLNLFFTKLQQLTLEQKKSTIQQLKKKNMQKTKEYFEYLLPYLKMDMRRTILSFFDIKTQSKLNIYELLVNLKIGGHDADIMMSNIQQIIKKIESNPNELKTIMKFIQLAKSDRKSYSMLLFISDQLIEGLEEVQDLNHDIIKGIRQLLLIREEMRMKIHEVEL